MSKFKLLISGIGFYTLSLAILLYEYPFWRHIGYHEYPGIPDRAYRRAAIGDYAGLAALMTIIGFTLPLLAWIAGRKFLPFFLQKGVRKNTIFMGILSLMFLNGYFFYSGVYEWGRPLPFPIHFEAIMFFAEFQFLNLVFWSPVLALAAALFGRWLFGESRLDEDCPSS